MEIVYWTLVILVIAVGLIGGVFQLMLFSNLEDARPTSIFLGGWVFDPNVLNSKGKHYRKLIFYCWGLIVFLVGLIMNIN